MIGRIGRVNDRFFRFFYFFFQKIVFVPFLFLLDRELEAQKVFQVFEQFFFDNRHTSLCFSFQSLILGGLSSIFFRILCFKSQSDIIFWVKVLDFLALQRGKRIMIFYNLSSILQKFNFVNAA